MASVNFNKTMDSVVNSQSFNKILSESSKDGRINADEANQLKAFVNKTELPSAQKEKLNGLIDKISTSTTGTEEKVFFIFKSTEEVTKKLSPKDLQELQSLAKSNKVAGALVNSIKSSQSNLTTQDTLNSNNANRSSAGFEPAGGASFPSQARSTSNSNRAMRADNINDYHLSQWVDPDHQNVGSQSGDCGPTAAAMILRANGIPADVNAVRVAANRTTRQGGGWAMDNGQISNAINKLSGGKIKQVGGVEPYTNPQKLISDMQKQLNEGKMPILCTGIMDPSKTYRHYVVVVGIDSNGSLQVADPAAIPRPPYNHNPITTISPEDLAVRMRNASSHGKPTNVTSFQAIR